MITVKLKNLTLKLCFGFFFVLAISAATFESYAAFSLLFCIFHELGHLLLMFVFGIRINEIKFYGAGIKISADNLEALDISKRATVYLGGCITNFLFAGFFFVIGSQDLALTNLIIGCFNLLPISYFDGGKLLELILPKQKLARKAVSCVCSAFAFSVLLYSAISLLRQEGVYYIVVLIFIVLCELLE